MKIMLIRSASRVESFGNASYMPLGLAYIAAVLENNGHEVRVTDLIVQKMSEDELVDSIVDFKPHVLGISAVTETINPGYDLIKRLSPLLPQLFTIAGGPHASAIPMECLEKGFDSVVIGEGEETISELVSAAEKLIDKQPDDMGIFISTSEISKLRRNILSRIRGIAWRDADHRNINPPRPYINDLDSLPFPARHLLPPIEKYVGQEALGSHVPVASIVTSRGCPFRCSFCFKAVFGNRFRARSPENILEEIDMLVKDYKAREIAIVDDSFTTDSKRVEKFCDLLLERDYKVKWSCPNGIRIDSVTPELLEKMSQAGCYRVALGIESGNQKILDMIGKGITLEQIVNTSKACRKAGIRTVGFYMIGNPGETEETMMDTINFACLVNNDYSQFLLPIPYPGSGLYKDIRENGIVHINDWDQYTHYQGTASFTYKNLTPGLLKKMRSLAYRTFYLRFSYFRTQIFNLENYIFFFRRLASIRKLFFS